MHQQTVFLSSKSLDLAVDAAELIKSESLKGLMTPMAEAPSCYCTSYQAVRHPGHPCMRLYQMYNATEATVRELA